eukprot:2091833-Amphidinium_carterae.2
MEVFCCSNTDVPGTIHLSSLMLSTSSTITAQKFGSIQARDSEEFLDSSKAVAQLVSTPLLVQSPAQLKKQYTDRDLSAAVKAAVKTALPSITKCESSCTKLYALHDIMMS